MFCPEGYFTLLEIYEFFDEYAGEKYLDEPAKFLKELDDGSMLYSVEDETQIKMDALQAWLFERFLVMNQRGFSACSSAGVVLRLSEHVFARRRLQIGPLPETREEQVKFVDHVRDPLKWVHTSYFIIDSVKAISPDDENPSPWDLADSEFLAPLNGWVVCWKPPSWPYDLNELAAKCEDWENHIIGGLEKHQARLAVNRGRPPKANGIAQRAVHAQYMERLRKRDLPQDQREATVAEAIAWVKLILGEDVSRSTMQRYLEPVFAAMDAQK